MNLPPYPTYPRLEDSRIILREVLPTDAQDLIEISYYNAQQARSMEDAEAMQQKIYSNYLEGNSIHWAIVDLKTKCIVGTCGYYRGFHQAAGELGCVLKPAYRGQGYMHAAMLLAINFGLAHMQLKRIWANTDPVNLKAVKLLEGLGFIKTADLGPREVVYTLPNEATLKGL